ncbi:MAG: zinc-binding dehydrogenase [Phycisphaerae bacterium]|nr:zinc-binding dehydrogenase [Phycisphaerae bacterium]
MRELRMLGNQRVDVVDADRPQATDDAPVIVAVRASGLCGSELGGYRADKPSDGNGGHEVAGQVVEAPDPSWIGKRVGVTAVIGCGQCDYCRAGQDTFCQHFKGYANAHAEFVARPQRAIRIFPDDLDCDWATAVLLSGDGLGVPYRIARRLGDTAGKTVLVIGLGPIGLGNVLVQTFGSARVIGIDPVPYRRELATQLGAECLDPTTDGFDDLVRGRFGRAIDVVIECVGKNPTLRQALQWVGPAGTVVAAGENPAAEFDLANTIIRKDLTLIGSWYYQPADFEGMLDMYRKGLQVERLITHRFPFEQAAEAFTLFASGQTGKVILESNE